MVKGGKIRRPARDYSEQFTKTPNDFFARVMGSHVRLSAKLVTLIVIRNTFGWHRRWASISNRDFERASGLSRQTVIEGVKIALEKRFISRARRGNRFFYRYGEVPKWEVERFLNGQDS